MVDSVEVSFGHRPTVGCMFITDGVDHRVSFAFHLFFGFFLTFGVRSDLSYRFFRDEIKYSEIALQFYDDVSSWRFVAGLNRSDSWHPKLWKSAPWSEDGWEASFYLLDVLLGRLRTHATEAGEYTRTLTLPGYDDTQVEHTVTVRSRRITHTRPRWPWPLLDLMGHSVDIEPPIGDIEGTSLRQGDWLHVKDTLEEMAQEEIQGIRKPRKRRDVPWWRKTQTYRWYRKTA